MFTNILSLSKAGIRVKAAVLTFNYLRYISIETSPLSLKSTFCMTDSGWLAGSDFSLVVGLFSFLSSLGMSQILYSARLSYGTQSPGSPSCLCSCEAWVKFFPHLSHENGFSPVCVRTWL